MSADFVSPIVRGCGGFEKVVFISCPDTVSSNSLTTPSGNTPQAPRRFLAFSLLLHERG